MKNLFTLILIALFAAPAKSAWVPHDTLHELHEYYNAHYEGITHTHVEHSHSDQKFEKIHHPVQLDGPLKSTDITHLSITEAGQKRNLSKLPDIFRCTCPPLSFSSVSWKKILV